jgi:aspartate/methionine/tyrosine aminotransferase
MAEKVRRVNGYHAEASDIMVTSGAIEGLFAVMRLLLDAGDEILLPDPGWPNFAMIAQLIGATSVGYPLTAETEYLPEVDRLEALVTPRTRAILLNTPSNPLGTVLSADRLRDLLAFAERHGLWVMSDECYDELTYESPTVSSAALDGSERIVGIYSMSKTHAMTGWRVGYVVGAPAVIKPLTKIQEPIVSCVNTPAQWAAAAALTGPQDKLVEMREAYHRRRDLVTAELDRAGISYVEPKGAFYLWVTGLPEGEPSMAFCRRLVSEHGVSVAPGDAFGTTGADAIRISLAASEDVLLEGTRRVCTAIAERRSAA